MDRTKDTNYYQYGIHDLRRIGRNIGVKGPTSLRKSDLIQRILEIEAGIEPAAPPSKRGRPVRDESNLARVQIIERPQADLSPLIAELEKLESAVSKIKQHLMRISSKR
jgi:hypothetical protein